MVRKIRKAAVIGSGVMGGGIAALLASAGIKTLMLDIVPFDLTEEEKKDPKARNRMVKAGYDNLLTIQPALLMQKKDIGLISIGNLEDDFDQLADCDWIVEVVVENLKVKQDLFARIDKVRKAGTVVSSNTSGIPLKAMSEGLSDDFRKHFLGTHFFNPVRYMHLLEIIPGAVAGVFQFAGSPGEAAASDDGGLAQGDDVALVLHTSGTTSRPKIVPLTHRNLCASARNIRSTLALTADDRCLNVMPLFHIHGLMAAIMASLSAGASVVCTPGFNALKFFGWLDEAKPTWYTAVPTMHQAILARAPRSKEIIERANLRFIRSSSSSLPPQVMKALVSVTVPNGDAESFVKAGEAIERLWLGAAQHRLAVHPLAGRGSARSALPHVVPETYPFGL